MPRFSAKAMEVFGIIWYCADINKANTLIDKLNTPEDIALGKILSSHYFLQLKDRDKCTRLLTKIEDSIDNGELKDPLNKILHYAVSALYYSGWDGPSISEERTQQHLEQVKQLYLNFEPVDDWETHFIEGWYYYILALLVSKNNENYLKAIALQKRSLVSWKRISEEEDDFCAQGVNNLGLYQRAAGKFNEAEKTLLHSLKIHQKYKNPLQYMPLTNLILLSHTKGNLQKANKFINQLMDFMKLFVSENGKHLLLGWAMNMKALVLYEEGNYEEALKLRKESLEYYKQFEGPWRIFYGYFLIFYFHYYRYKVTKDGKKLLQANDVYQDLLEFSSTYPNNKNMKNYSKFAHALILKYGNIRKKSKAIDILEELVDTYPEDIKISLELLELLFEDALVSQDQDIIDQIDELREKIQKAPLRNNPLAISSFISQQIFLAKYIYYIKGDISVALNILENSIKHVRNFKLDNLEKMLNAEIQILEKELTKWDDVDISIKERIKKSEFNKYIQQALNLANKQL